MRVACHFIVNFYGVPIEMYKVITLRLSVTTSTGGRDWRAVCILCAYGEPAMVVFIIGCRLQGEGRTHELLQVFLPWDYSRFFTERKKDTVNFPPVTRYLFATIAFLTKFLPVSLLNSLFFFGPIEGKAALTFWAGPVVLVHTCLRLLETETQDLLTPPFWGSGKLYGLLKTTWCEFKCQDWTN